MTRRIVVADDHPMFRDALCRTIADAVPGAAVVEAGTLEDAANALADGGAELVLLDLNMPGMQGFAGLAYLRSRFPDAPVAVISANEEVSVVRCAIQAGATGYVPKSLPACSLVSAVRALLEGGPWIPDGLGRAVASGAPAGPENPAALLARLTPQQTRVLMMLNDGMTNKLIAYALAVSEGTVKAHVSAILQKLGVGSRTQAVILVRQLTDEADAPQETIRRAAEGA